MWKINAKQVWFICIKYQLMVKQSDNVLTDYSIVVFRLLCNIHTNIIFLNTQQTV